MLTYSLVCSNSHLHQQRQRAHPYGQKSQPGSPVYDRPALSRSSSTSQHAHSSHSSSTHHAAPPSPIPSPTQADRTLPGISSLGALFNGNGNGSTSNPPSRHNSPPGSRAGSPHYQPGSHFSSTTASTDSLASMGNGSGNGYRSRPGFSMTPMSGPPGSGAYFPQHTAAGSRSASEEMDARGEDDEGEDQLMES